MLIEAPHTLGKRSKKEMLSIAFETDSVLHRTRPVVRINSSSLELIQLCKRKADYVLNREFSSNEENAATLFGSAIHKALETWYCSSREDRRSDLSSCPGFEPVANSAGHDCGKCRAMRSFHAVAGPLNTLEMGDKRHPYNGERILETYFKKYQDDPFEVYVDKEGPVVERRLEAVLIDEPDLKVIYFGTVDCVLKDVQTAITLVTDHKTTSSLGTEFYNRLKPNFQYCGYVWLVQQVLGLNTDMFMVNGIQVAKTKTDLARQVVTYTPDDFKEWKTAVRWNVEEFLRAKEFNTWPMNAPNPCTQWGGCQFRDVCAADSSLRENMLAGLFTTTKDCA